MKRFAILLSALLALVAAPLAAQDFPALSGRVVDDANILTPEFEQELKERLTAIEIRSGVQIVAVTVERLDGMTPKTMADTMLDRWLKAEKKSRNAAILLLAPNDRTFTVQIRSYVEDAEAAKKSIEAEGNAKLLLSQLADLIQPAVVPFFKNKEWSGGLSAGLDALESEIDNGHSPQSHSAKVL